MYEVYTLVGHRELLPTLKLRELVRFGHVTRYNTLPKTVFPSALS